MTTLEKYIDHCERDLSVKSIESNVLGCIYLIDDERKGIIITKMYKQKLFKIFVRKEDMQKMAKDLEDIYDIFFKERIS